MMNNHNTNNNNVTNNNNWNNNNNKYAIFAFRGEGPCFMHAILNAEDMRRKSFDAIVIMEGGSVKHISSIISGTFPISLCRA